MNKENKIKPLLKTSSISFIEKQQIFYLDNTKIKLINKKCEDYSDIYFDKCENFIRFYGTIPSEFLISSISVDIKYSYEKDTQLLYIIIIQFH